MDEQQRQDDTAPSSTEAQPVVESPNGVSVAADQSASGTSLSVASASPAGDTGAAASSGETAGEQGNVGAANAEVAATDSISQQSSAPVAASSLDGDLPNAGAITSLAGGATPVVTDADVGNVLAGGVLPADIASDSSEPLGEPTDDHPAKPHLSALRRKIESGEAIVMAELIRLITAIEESL